MATKTENGNERRSIALALFAAGVGSGRIASAAGMRSAIECYKLADQFIAASAQVEAGAVEVESTGPQLADCSAPNQPVNFPHNLVSRRFGDAGLVNRVSQWLNKRPRDKDGNEPSGIVEQFNRDFTGAFPFPDDAVAPAPWTKTEIALARKLLPQYAS